MEGPKLTIRWEMFLEGKQAFPNVLYGYEFNMGTQRHTYLNIIIAD